MALLPTWRTADHCRHHPGVGHYTHPNVISSSRPSHLPLHQPAIAKRYARSTQPTPAWSRRRRARRNGLSHACAPVKCRLQSSSPRLPKPTVPRPALEATPETSPLPHPELHVQPYYAALSLAARGCLPQPLGAVVAAIAARSRQWERAAGGTRAKKAFGCPIPDIEQLYPEEI